MKISWYIFSKVMCTLERNSNCWDSLIWNINSRSLCFFLFILFLFWIDIRIFASSFLPFLFHHRQFLFIRISLLSQHFSIWPCGYINHQQSSNHRENHGKVINCIVIYGINRRQHKRWRDQRALAEHVIPGKDFALNIWMASGLNRNKRRKVRWWC